MKILLIAAAILASATAHAEDISKPTSVALGARTVAGLVVAHEFSESVTTASHQEVATSMDNCTFHEDAATSAANSPDEYKVSGTMECRSRGGTVVSIVYHGSAWLAAADLPANSIADVRTSEDKPEATDDIDNIAYKNIQARLGNGHNDYIYRLKFIFDEATEI